VLISSIGPCLGLADLFVAKFHQRIADHFQHAVYKEHMIGTHSSLHVLLRTADGYLRDHPLANQAKIDLRRAARWRGSPITENQRMMMMSRLRAHLVTMPVAVGLEEREKVALEGVWLGRGWKELVEIDSLTKGEAADVLTR